MRSRNGSWNFPRLAESPRLSGARGKAWFDNIDIGHSHAIKPTEMQVAVHVLASIGSDRTLYSKVESFIIGLYERHSSTTLILRISFLFIQMKESGQKSIPTENDQCISHDVI